jgi:hypothetical protein
MIFQFDKKTVIVNYSKTLAAAIKEMAAAQPSPHTSVDMTIDGHSISITHKNSWTVEMAVNDDAGKTITVSMSLPEANTLVVALKSEADSIQ